MRLVSGFQHFPGVHCGSTALRDMLHHIGIDYSEAMCFGLGSGLDMFYFSSPDGRPLSRLIYGRTIDLEHTLCVHLALEFQEGQDEAPVPGDAERAWQAAKGWLDRDVPLLLHVELSQLAYYRTRTPFPGHRVLLVGYDDARQIAFLADTAFPELQEISYAALQAARTAQIPPLPLHNEWLAIEPTLSPRPLGQAIRLALKENALGMNLDRAPYRGIMGMEAFAEELPRWSALPDWVNCARLAYQNIEIRGTGGGFFRRMYAQFLSEAEAMDAELRAARLAETLEEIAEEWSALAHVFERAAAEPAPPLLQDASRMALRLAKREESFWGRVLNLQEKR